MEEKTLDNLTQNEIDMIRAGLVRTREEYDRRAKESYAEGLMMWYEIWRAKSDTCSDLLRRLSE